MNDIQVRTEIEERMYFIRQTKPTPTISRSVDHVMDMIYHECHGCDRKSIDIDRGFAIVQSSVVSAAMIDLLLYKTRDTAR